MNIRQIAVTLVLGSLAVACTSVTGKSTPETTTSAAESAPATSKRKTAESPESDGGTTATNLATGDAGASHPKPVGTGPFGDDDDDDDDSTTTSGTINTNGGRVANGQDCCFGGQYFQCPNEVACFGGVDVGACETRCNGDFTCEIACTRKLSSAPPPDGCTQKPAPSGITCGE